MSKVLAFWKYAFELSAEEFAQLDSEGLAIMAAAASEAGRRELRRWLASKIEDSEIGTALERPVVHPVGQK